MVFCLLSYIAFPAIAQKDPRYRKITEKELARLIRTMPITSVKHRFLPINTLPLKKVAIREYSSIWRRNPKNPWASLRYGRNLQSYVLFASYYPKEKLLRGSAEANKLMARVGNLLQTALRAKPNLAEANTAYGWFLIDHENILRQGFSYLEKGVELDPKDLGARALLAEALMNPSNSLYNPQRAEKELLTSTCLNPNNAYTQYLLTRLYGGEKQYQKQQKALDAYCALVTPEMAKAAKSHWQPDITKGLAKNKAKVKM